jgi:hypothetical protein
MLALGVALGLPGFGLGAGVAVEEVGAGLFTGKGKNDPATSVRHVSRYEHRTINVIGKGS